MPYFPIIGLMITVLLAVIAATWKLSSAISSVVTKVDLVLTNHLPHLDDKIDELRLEIRSLKDKLDY